MLVHSKLRRTSTLIQPGSKSQPPGLKTKVTLTSGKVDIPVAFKTAANGELDLGNKNLSDMHSNDLVKAIKGSSGHIRDLDLSKNRITDEGLLHIMKAICESQIENISFNKNKLTDKCVEGIVGMLKTNKTLKVLDLQNNAIGTSRLMKNKLKNALPQIEILL